MLPTRDYIRYDMARTIKKLHFRRHVKASLQRYSPQLVQALTSQTQEAYSKCEVC